MSFGCPGRFARPCSSLASRASGPVAAANDVAVDRAAGSRSHAVSDLSSHGGCRRRRSRAGSSSRSPMRPDAPVAGRVRRVRRDAGQRLDESAHRDRRMRTGRRRPRGPSARSSAPTRSRRASIGRDEPHQVRRRPALPVAVSDDLALARRTCGCSSTSTRRASRRPASTRSAIRRRRRRRSSSRDPTLISVDATGLVRALRRGSATYVVATAGGQVRQRPRHRARRRASRSAPARRRRSTLAVGQVVTDVSGAGFCVHASSAERRVRDHPVSTTPACRARRRSSRCAGRASRRCRFAVAPTLFDSRARRARRQQVPPMHSCPTTRSRSRLRDRERAREPRARLRRARLDARAPRLSARASATAATAGGRRPASS